MLGSESTLPPQPANRQRPLAGCAAARATPSAVAPPRRPSGAAGSVRRSAPAALPAADLGPFPDRPATPASAAAVRPPATPAQDGIPLASSGSDAAIPDAGATSHSVPWP